MGFTEAIKTCLSKYATFSGRATRSEYWWFFLFVAIIEITIGTIVWTQTNFWEKIVAWYYISLAPFILPLIAVTVRRLHDSGKSGWLVLLRLIPYIGRFAVLVMLLLEGDIYENKYGDNPRKMDDTVKNMEV